LFSVVFVLKFILNVFIYLNFKRKESAGPLLSHLVPR
jgi:hypothetical protein